MFYLLDSNVCITYSRLIVHTICRLRQSPWLTTAVWLLTTLRNSAVSKARNSTTGSCSTRRRSRRSSYLTTRALSDVAGNAAKPFAELTPDDFRAYPVWQYGADPQDAMARSIAVYPVTDLTNRFIGATVTLANGAQTDANGCVKLCGYFEAEMEKPCTAGNASLAIDVPGYRHLRASLSDYLGKSSLPPENSPTVIIKLQPSGVRN